MTKPLMLKLFKIFEVFYLIKYFPYSIRNVILCIYPYSNKLRNLVNHLLIELVNFTKMLEY